MAVAQPFRDQGKKRKTFCWTHQSHHLACSAMLSVQSSTGFSNLRLSSSSSLTRPSRLALLPSRPAPSSRSEEQKASIVPEGLGVFATFTVPALQGADLTSGLSWLLSALRRKRRSPDVRRPLGEGRVFFLHHATSHPYSLPGISPPPRHLWCFGKRKFLSGFLPCLC